MNKIFSHVLFGSLALCGMVQGAAVDSDRPTILPAPDVKAAKIERAYRFSTKIEGVKHYKSVMILEDGYTFYNLFEKDDIWAAGDEVILTNTYAEGIRGDMFSNFVNAENVTQGKNITALRMGWTLPGHLEISDVKYDKADEQNKTVTISLTDGSQWLFNYAGDYANAKKWRKKDKVLLIVNPKDGSDQNPFVNGQAYSAGYEYNLVNLNIKKNAFAERAATLLQNPK